MVPLLLLLATQAVEGLNPKYEEMYFSMPVDHINREPGTFQVKALVHKGDPTAPLFVYTGNEAPIEDFYEMTGWLVDYLGPKYNATVAFIEHRFYGESIPSPRNLKYLDSTQALWDFANITLVLKPTPKTKVIAFGGSYGGMLSAMFRMKFPHIVDGAIASSAPLLQALQPWDAIAKQITGIYENVTSECPKLISQGYTGLSFISSRPDYFQAMETLFKPCQSIKEPGDVVALQDLISNALWGMAQYAYPYPANGLPGDPVSAACSIIARYNTEERDLWSILTGFNQIFQLYYNSTGTATCFDISSGGDSTADAWSYQTCTEFYMPYGQSGWPNDMFNPEPFDPDTFDKNCLNTYGVKPKISWEKVNYGMTSNYMNTLQYASNIIFSYGTEDPWAVGCFQKDFGNKNILILPIKGASHHYDLRAPSKLDTINVIQAREIEEDHIDKWAGLHGD